jgi:BASS family bile acid:Na+ symporter
MTRLAAGASHFLHEKLLWFLLACYAIAAVVPGPGLWLRGVSLGEYDREGTRITLPMVMLALLLLSAGLGVKPSELRRLLRRPAVLLVGLFANLLVPIVLIFATRQGLRLWHSPHEVQTILVGLALIGSMPVAGSSTAWAQNSNGDLALSLGLVLFSTALSPLTTPVALHAVALMASGEHAQALHALAANGTEVFLLLCVVAPSLLGLVLRWGLGEARVAALRPAVRLLTTLDLLLLSYANAAVSLPQAVAEPDWDFLGLTLGVAAGLCVLAFASGALLGRLLRLEPGRVTALVFGLGMNNNGTGLVLAGVALAAYPGVMLPIIVYNLVQHIVAGVADFLLSRAAARGETA